MKWFARIAIVALLALAAFGWTRLRFDADVLSALPAKVPAVRGLQLHQRHFAGAEELIIRLRLENEAEAAAAAQSLALALRRQTSLVASAWWQPPWEEHPGQLAGLVAEVWLSQPPEKFAELGPRLEPVEAEKAFARARQRLATSFSPGELARLGYDPLGLAEILADAGGAQPGEEKAAAMFQSPSGRSRYIWVKARPPLPGYRECEAWLNEVKGAVERWDINQRIEPLMQAYRDQAKARQRKYSDQDELIWRGGAVAQVSRTRSKFNFGYTGRPAFMAEIGGGMERDLAGPSLGTLAIICLLFYWVHRRWLPLLWLVVLLLLDFAATLGIGGLVLGPINVVSLGFAAILLGLAEDFAIVMLQAARAHPQMNFQQVKWHAQAGIYWSAVTTAAAFLLLNFSGLPGLGQLGTLVAIGIGLAALVMVHGYLPPLWKHLPRDPSSRLAASLTAPAPPPGNFVALVSLALLGFIAIKLAGTGLPAFDTTTNALRPKSSQAYAVLDELKGNAGGGPEPLLVLVEAPSLPELLAAAQQCRAEITRLVRDGVLADGQMPLELVRQPERQAANAVAARQWQVDRDELIRRAAAQGFAQDALAMTLAVLDRLANPAAEPPPGVRWLMERCQAGAGGKHYLLGSARPALAPEAVAAAWRPTAAGPARIYLTNWELMGTTMAAMVRAELPYLLLGISALVLLVLWLAFRRWTEVLLSVAMLAASLLLLLGWMRLAGWQWNLMNLMAVPLLLGLGVDFSLHMLLALRLYKGDLRAAHHAVGKALLLAGATTVAAFASLTFSSNAGLASLGRVAAAGLLCCQLTGIYLLPRWWRALMSRRP